MIDYIFFGIGLLFLAGTLYRMYRARNDFSVCISNFSIGVLITSMFFLFPTYFRTYDHDLGASIVQSVQSGFLVLSGRQSVSQLSHIELDVVSKTIYLIINYILLITAPVCLSALVVAQFGDTADKIRRWLLCRKSCHIFSELNEQSLALAQSLSEKEGKRTLIFCNTKDVSKSLRNQVRTFGGVMLYADVKDLRFTKRYDHVCFYQISKDEDVNARKASALLQWQERILAQEKKERSVELFTFIGTRNKALTVEEIPHKYVKLRIIDEIALLCDYLLMTKPLYTEAVNQNKISVVIVGAGKTGMQMIKTALWCGQMEKYSLEIHVFDKNPKLKQLVYADCPELRLPEYDIHFYDSDATCDIFESLILEHCSDATYIVLSMKDDNLNIETGLRLRALFLRNAKICPTHPTIHARVRDDATLQTISANSEYLKKRQIHTFGHIRELFHIDMLVNSKLETMALMVHLYYYGALGLPENHPDYIYAKQQFDIKSYNRNSSMANALHIQYKLFDCGLLKNGQMQLTNELADVFETYIQKDEKLEALAQQEHLRWNAYTRTLGYCVASCDMVQSYAKSTDKKSYINEIALLHPCLVSWEELDALSAFVNDFYKENTAFEKKDFKEADRLVVKAIPEMIRKANEV